MNNNILQKIFSVLLGAVLFWSYFYLNYGDEVFYRRPGILLYILLGGVFGSIIERIIRTKRFFDQRVDVGRKVILTGFLVFFLSFIPVLVKTPKAFFDFYSSYIGLALTGSLILVIIGGFISSFERRKNSDKEVDNR